MRDVCTKHPFDEAADTCRDCRSRYCPDCLVYTHGETQPPFCIPCALAAAGLKTAARRRARVSWGRTRVGLLAASGGALAVVAPLLAHLH